MCSFTGTAWAGGGGGGYFFCVYLRLYPTYSGWREVEDGGLGLWNALFSLV